MSEEREKAIRERAYALWEKGGSGHGQHGEHWDQATREIDAEMGKPKPATKAAAKRGPKPKVVAAPVVAKPAPAAKAVTAKSAAAAKPEKPVAAAKPKAAAKPAAASEPTPVATAVGKAKQAADKVVATVKRATKGSPKK